MSKKIVLDDNDIQHNCFLVGTLCGLPTRWYKKDELKYIHTITELPFDPINAIKKEIFALKERISYYIVGDFFYYGILHIRDNRIIIGPTFQITPSSQQLHNFAFMCDVPTDLTNSFIDSIKNIRRYPLETLLLIINGINYSLTKEKIELKNITFKKEDQKTIDELMTNQIEQDKNMVNMRRNSYQMEELLARIIRNGDLAELDKMTSQNNNIKIGVLAETPLRQSKNLFIAVAAIVSRAAIRGGLPYDEALTLSDGYIQHCELLTDNQSIYNLEMHMVRTYTERVAKLKNDSQESDLAKKVRQYVKDHLSEPVNTKAIADHFYLSRTHFSAKFKKETGETISNFVLKEKIEEAKYLLQYTDKTIQTIGSYLGFSSQSHFVRTFKKYLGVTPGEYRENH